MADFHNSYTSFSPGGYGNSSSASPTNATVPSINIGGLPGLPASPVNEFLGRSLDIKKQLLQSLQGHAAASGGVTKPKSRRNSAYYIKTEDGDGAESGKLGENGEPGENGDDQGIERKRRDNINEKIQELLTLIPGEYFQDVGKDGVPPAANSPSAGQGPGYEEALAMAKSTGTRDGKPNKGQILTQAVEYIQHLQNSIDENNRREVELFLKMKTLEKQAQGQSTGGNVPVAVGPTSAERALGEIGVGPESEQYFRNVLLETPGAHKNDA